MKIVHAPKVLEFFVPGIPAPQPRPRVFKSGGVATDSKNSKSWKFATQIMFKQKFDSPYPIFEKDIPLFLHVIFHLPKPKSTRRSLPCVRPDLDNLQKCMQDALDKLAWHDDGQICTSLAEKVYARPKCNPGMQIYIERIEPDE